MIRFVFGPHAEEQDVEELKRHIEAPTGILLENGPMIFDVNTLEAYRQGRITSDSLYEKDQAEVRALDRFIGTWNSGKLEAAKRMYDSEFRGGSAQFGHYGDKMYDLIFERFSETKSPPKIYRENSSKEAFLECLESQLAKGLAIAKLYWGYPDRFLERFERYMNSMENSAEMRDKDLVGVADGIDGEGEDIFSPRGRMHEPVAHFCRQSGHEVRSKVMVGDDDMLPENMIQVARYRRRAGLDAQRLSQDDERSLLLRSYALAQYTAMLIENGQTQRHAVKKTNGYVKVLSEDQARRIIERFPLKEYEYLRAVREMGVPLEV